MSHVTNINLQITDLQAVRDMCQANGWTFSEASTYRWYQRHVGDHPIPEGFTVADMGKCDYKISIPGVDYDIGLVKSGGQYVPMWDFYDSGLKNAMGGDKAPVLVVEYTRAYAKRFARKRGLKLKEKRVDTRQKKGVALCLSS